MHSRNLGQPKSDPPLSKNDLDRLFVRSAVLYNFHPHFFPPDKDGGFGKTLFKVTPPGGDVDTDELGLVFFGEICSSAYGTAMSAKGNHYVGTPEYPKVRNTHF